MISPPNLLPVSFRKRLLVRAGIRRWLVCTGVGLILTCCLSVYEYSRMSIEKQRVSHLNSDAESVQKISAENGRLREQAQELIEKQKSVSKIKNVSMHMQLLGLVSRCARPLGDKLQVINYKLEERVKQPEVATRQPQVANVGNAVLFPQPTKIMFLELKGLAENDSLVAEFVRELDESECFDTVDLKVVNRVELSSKVLRAYQIECTCCSVEDPFVIR